MSLSIAMWRARACIQRWRRRLGKTTLGTELGSAGQFTPEILRITEDGLYNVLRHTGILDGAVTKPAQEPQVVGATEREDYIMAPVSGIFEPFFDLCEEVRNGEAVGQIHNVEQPFQEPVWCMPKLTAW